MAKGSSASTSETRLQRDLAFMLYPYKRSTDQDSTMVARHRVVIVGAGLVGLAMAVDLALKNIPVLVLDDQEGVGEGSRAIAFAKRTLEIFDRHGVGDAIVGKGVTWNRGKVFYRDKQIYAFDLLPEHGHERPAFVNLQQPYCEKYLFERIVGLQRKGASIEVRGCNRLTDIQSHGDHSRLTIDTPDGPYEIDADWTIACDGSRSTVRDLMGMGFQGRVFEDNFLIADIRMKHEHPSERWFWFKPPFEAAGDSMLLHKQPDDIWRVDCQLGWNIDREKELRPENISARVGALLGADVPFDIVWTSIYTFQCRRMETFRKGRVLFAGDAAHLVSPFGARGANSGIQDVDNLGWKLQLVLEGSAPHSLLDSYSAERVAAADENIANSTRSTDFITPKSEMSRIFQDAVLNLAAKVPFAQAMVNSGRLSKPRIYDDSPLNGADVDGFPHRSRPGAPMDDAPLGDTWLLRQFGNGFKLLAINQDVPDLIEESGLTVQSIRLTSHQNTMVGDRYLGGEPGAVYLIRPDQHVAARWRSYDEKAVRSALRRTIGLERDQ